MISIWLFSHVITYISLSHSLTAICDECMRVEVRFATSAPTPPHDSSQVATHRSSALNLALPVRYGGLGVLNFARKRPALLFSA